MRNILQVDASGFPQKWMDGEEAVMLISQDQILWSVGPVIKTLRGGYSSISSKQSVIEVPAIIATKSAIGGRFLTGEPRLTRFNHKLFERDRNICIYCGNHFHSKELTREHIMPVSKGGKNNWMNVAACCKKCNWDKGDKTVEEAGLSMLYLPYIPNRYEDFILQQGGKRIIADQMDFLMQKIPANSRLKAH